MQVFDHNYYLHYVYTVEQWASIEDSINEVKQRFSDQKQIQVSIEQIDCMEYYHQAQNFKQEENQTYLVEYQLNSQYCINLAQLIDLVIKKCISIKQVTFRQILQKTVKQIVHNDRSLQLYLKSEMSALNCWIVLKEPYFFNEFFKDEFEVVILLADESQYFQKYSYAYDNSWIKQYNEKLLNYCNQKLSHKLQGTYSIVDKNYEVSFKRYDHLNLDSDIVIADNQKAAELFQLIVKLKESLRFDTIFDDYLVSSYFQIQLFDSYRQQFGLGFDQQYQLLQITIKILKQLEKIVDLQVYQNISNKILNICKYYRIFNLNFNRKNVCDSQDRNYPEIIQYVTYIIQQIPNQYKYDKWSVFKGSTKKILDLTSCFKDICNYEIILQTEEQLKNVQFGLTQIEKNEIKQFDDQYKNDLRSWLMQDLIQLFDDNFKKESRCSSYFKYQIRFLLFFHLQYKSESNNYFALVTKLSAFEDYLIKNNSQMVQYLEKDFINDTLENQKLFQYYFKNTDNEEMTAQIHNTIHQFSKSNGLSDLNIQQIKENLNLILKIFPQYIEFLNSQYGQKLQKFNIRLIDEQVRQIKSQWQTKIANKPDIVEILLLKPQYTKIIIRDFFEEHIKPIIDNAYKNVIIEEFNPEKQL